MKNKAHYLEVTIDAVDNKGRRITRKLQYKSIAIMQFLNNQHHLVELTTGAISFYFYACERMNSSNEVMLDIHCKNDYIAFIRNVTDKKEFLSISALDKYMGKLKELGLLILVGTEHSAHYLVSPKYSFKGTEPARKKLLKAIIEERIHKGVSLHGLIDSTEEDFFK